MWEVNSEGGGEGFIPIFNPIKGEHIRQAFGGGQMKVLHKHTPSGITDCERVIEDLVASLPENQMEADEMLEPTEVSRVLLWIQWTSMVGSITLAFVWGLCNVLRRFL